ncbi:MAG TPA: sulfite exporter TauE/SafE family protein [Methylomirabilota bacterium]|nr:sulfite exporter TauE/SafE family protein [Methylomirabilota bacterium]
MSWTEILCLAAAAMAAGAINAVAGGGTLITFPTLLFFRTAPVIANATSTLALLVGTAGSTFGYREHLGAVKIWLWRFAPVSILGGLIGSALLTQTSDKTFAKLVPFLILFATMVFLAQGFFRRFAGLENRARPVEERRRHIGLAIVFQFAVSIYGGYFGAGIGILMLASLGFIGLTHIHEMNAVKTVLSSLINLVASIWFVCAGLIHWPKAGVMTVGALVGYYLGAHYSQRIPQIRVRQLITAIGFTLSAVTFYEQFMK